MQAIYLGKRRALHASWAAGFRVAPKATRRGPGRTGLWMGTYGHTHTRTQGTGAHTHTHTPHTHMDPTHRPHTHILTATTYTPSPHSRLPHTHAHDIRISDAGETC